MPLIFQKFIYREDLRANPTVMYVFGDNEARTGKGGQAQEMRGEPNAFGVRTKRGPGRTESDYWTDEDLDDKRQMIEKDFVPIKKALSLGAVVVMPLDGLGTGLSELPKRAPQALKLIEEQIKKIKTPA